MSPDHQSILWIGAFRYYCGRMTYAVSSFVDLLVWEWPNLPEHAQQIIKRDLEEDFVRDDSLRVSIREGGMTWLPLGHDCDRAQWERVRRLWQRCGEEVSEPCNECVSDRFRVAAPERSA